MASSIGFSLAYSGTGGTVWGWLVSALMIQSTAFAMAELCSSMPTAGGLYYASAVLAPEGYGPLCSWIVGWSNFFAFATVPCSVNYALAAMLVAVGEVSNANYIPKTWHVYVTLLALLIIQGLVTIQSTKFIGRVSKVCQIPMSTNNALLMIIFYRLEHLPMLSYSSCSSSGFRLEVSTNQR